MMSVKQTAIPPTLQLSQATNPDITQDWTDQDWMDDRKLALLCWKRLDDVLLLDPDTASSIKRQVQWMQANINVRLITFELKYNVYRLIRI